MSTSQPKTGAKCECRQGVERDNCPRCEGTGMVIDFKAIREKPQQPAEGAQFTPGPWRIIDSRDQSKATIVGADFPAMGFVADVNLCRNNTHQQVDGRANAALIAAAPAMYEALQEIDDQLDQFTVKAQEDLGLRGALLRIRDALAQAEGREG